jgi:hypothetical protein
MKWHYPSTLSPSSWIPSVHPIIEDRISHEGLPSNVVYVDRLFRQLRLHDTLDFGIVLILLR